MSPSSSGDHKSHAAVRAAPLLTAQVLAALRVVLYRWGAGPGRRALCPCPANPTNTVVTVFEVSIASTCGLVAMTSASHAEGRQLDPGQVYALMKRDERNVNVTGNTDTVREKDTTNSICMHL